MTANQENKIDALTAAIATLSSDIRATNIHQKQHFQVIVDMKKDIRDLQDKDDSREADRNKIVGITWASSIVTGLVAFAAALIALFKS